MNYQTCKLTDKNGATQNGAIFAPGVRVDCSGELIMCKNGIHYYQHPLLASFFRPIHVDWADLWLGEPGAEQLHNGEVKSCSRAWISREQIPLPEITPEQRVEIAIDLVMRLPNLCAYWRAWALRWLNGSDRGANAAVKAVHVARADASSTPHVANAAVDAANAAANAANAASTAFVAASTANAAASAAHTAQLAHVVYVLKDLPILDTIARVLKIGDES